MDLTVASGFELKPDFLPSEASETSDRSPPAGLSPKADQPSLSADPESPADHVGDLGFVESLSVSSTSPTQTGLTSTSSPLQKDNRQETVNMYDPFSPTDVEKEERAAEAEEVAEKYDPFEPTGSPVSDNIVHEDLKDQAENHIQTESGKAEEPPDSTDALPDSPKRSPGLLSIRRTVDCSTIKEEHSDSERSEIEEGEIVGLVDRDAGRKQLMDENISVNSPSTTYFGPKPERILRVLDGDGFVSVRADPDWQPSIEPDEEPEVGVEDLRRKLVSRRKERYITFPGTATLTPEMVLPSGHLHSPPQTTPPPALQDTSTKTHKSSKSSNNRERLKSKDAKTGTKEERRKKKRKEKRSLHKSKEKPGNQKCVKETKAKRSTHSRSSKRKKRQRSPAAPANQRSFSRASEERNKYKPQDTNRHRDRSRDRHRERDRSRDRIRERSREQRRERDRSREKNKDRDRSRSRDRHWDRDHNRVRDRDHPRSQRNEEDEARKDRERKRRRPSRSRDRDSAKRFRRSSERDDADRDRQRDRNRRRDGRPVVPPSIQELNGSDLFAIKRTITVTTTTTTTTVPGSPRLGTSSPGRSPSDVDKSHRKKKRKGRSSPEKGRSRHSRPGSLSPPRYHNYESDRYSDKLDIDVLSLDGEALDSDYDYPSLEDSPLPALPPPLPSPKAKSTSKAGQLKRKSAKKNSESTRIKSNNFGALSTVSDCAPVSTGLPVVKRTRKVKDKNRDKGSRKELGRSGKSKKDGTSSRKGKLQSKVSVLVREGVSSTTGSSGKIGMDLLGSGGPGGGTGSSVVGGSIAVVFCRDNESRSPFLKPCSEPLSLGGRSKDLSSMGKRSSLAAPPSSLNSSVALPSQKAKPASITSTSSSASSPSSSLVTKRRRRVVKKTREKVGTASSKADEGVQGGSSAWAAPSVEASATSAEVCKAASPHPGPPGSAPCSSSSSSSSTSVLPPSSSPPPSPPPSVAPLRDTRESSPDSQTVDSSCKTPEPSFLTEECPSQTSPTPPPSSPSLMPSSLGGGLSLTPTDPPKPCSPPPCPSSSGSCGLSSLSLDPSVSSVSSSSTNKPPPPPPPAVPALPWGLQTGVDCTAGGVLALTALLFKMEEANIASRAKAQEFIQATSQILSQANQNQSAPLASSTSQAPPPPSLPPPPRLSPTQLFLHNAHLHSCAQTPPPILSVGGGPGDNWDHDSKDPDKYLKKLHTQERAVEEVKLAIKPYYQRKDINKDEYKDILRKAVHKICHSRTGEINPVKVSNLVKLYVQRYKYFRKHGRKMDDDREDGPGGLHSSA